MSEDRAAYKKHHFIYRTTCFITGKYYIGMHSTNDPNDDYLGSGKRLGLSVKKYGRENHVREIVEMFSDRLSLRDREAELITEELLTDPLCLNISKGGNTWLDVQKLLGANLGRKHTELARRNMAESHRGSKRSDASKKKMSERAKEREARKKELGYRTSDETRQKMSASGRKRAERERMEGRVMSEATRAKISAGRKGKGLGRVCTEETRQKISAKNKGRKRKPLTPDGRRRLIAALTGQKRSEETRRKLSEVAQRRPRKPKLEIVEHRSDARCQPRSDDVKRKISETRRRTNAERRLRGKEEENPDVDHTQDVGKL